MMSTELLLFILRIASAALLLAFLGLLAWLMWQDVRVVRETQETETTMLGTLVVVESTKEELPVGQEYGLQVVTSIGRHVRNDIVLDESYVSSQHARVSWYRNQWWLQDLGSRNGTLLNGAQLLDETVISDGDIFSVGSVRLELNLNSQPEPKEH